ncbi:MAG: hypothetical protein SGI72_17690 [Planctomycetota bacterium]|nr:hypothetical protein [Planctomycetota bacterium]
MILATLLFALSPLARIDVPPPPPPIPGEATAPLSNVDGKELIAGVIPESTTPKARERWSRVLSASLPAGVERKPVTAFDLSIDVQYQASAQQTNMMPKARYQWLAPGFVRADTGRGRAHLRGPSGSYLLDANTGEVIKLDIGRENAVDRRMLDEEAGIAANFARLTDPNSIKIRKLVELSGPPSFLPDALKDAAKKLAWLELESPDFFVMRPLSLKVAPLARVTLGVNVIDQRVELVIVDDASLPSTINPSSAVLRLSKYTPVDGFQVPWVIFVWLPAVQDPQAALEPTRWMPKETMSLYVLEASLRAPLKPDDFLPPKK